MNKIKKSLLDDCREHLILAVGSAAGAGEHEIAPRINAILIELDIECEMCYTGKNARKARKNEEGKKMKKYIWVEHFENWNNRGYSLHNTETGKNVAWIGEENYCEYTISANAFPMGMYRFSGTLAEAMTACIKTAGINPEEVEPLA